MPHSQNMKNELRQLIRARKNEHSAQELAAMSEKIIQAIMHDSDVSHAQVIMAYYSLPDEVCTHNLIPLLHAQGKTILLPVVQGQDPSTLRLAQDKLSSGQDIVLKEYKSTESLIPGKYNIQEPQGPPFTDYHQIQVALIPGMAFDADGNRLGRGKGYYDRFLPKLKNAKKIGICFDFQILEQVPTEKHDARVEKVITSNPSR